MVSSKVLHVLFCFCKKKVSSICRQMWKLRADNRRRLLHSLKVGMALALVTLLVLLQDVYGQLSKNTIWAVMTVVVVFEYTLGATLSKGLNRGLGTVLAAILGLFVNYFANLAGSKLHPYIVGLSVFMIGAITTFIRFIPRIKAKYDYGVVIFLVTFCLVVVSGHGLPHNVHFVLDRFVTVMVGCGVCLLVSLLIFPIWAGNDLHDIVLNNIESLAGAVEECAKEYFRGNRKLERLSSKICKGEPYEDPIYKLYRAVLNSKSSEESLANFASWEPRCGRLKFTNPWKYYVQVGGILRHCAYTVSALHGCLLSEIQAPDALRETFAEPCINISIEIGKTLREVGENLKNTRRCRPKKRMMENINAAVKQLHLSVNAHPHLFVNPDMWPVHSEDEISSECAGKDEHYPGASSEAVQADPKSSKAAENEEKAGDSQADGLVGLEIESMASISMTKEEAGTESMSRRGNAHVCNQGINRTRGFAESLSLATVASLLVEIVSRLEFLVNAVVVLEEKAKFKGLACRLSDRSISVTKTEHLIRDHTIIQVAE